MDVLHRAMASPVGRWLSSFARARASSSSARRTWSADPGVSFLVSALAAPVHIAGRRDHAFTSAIVSISTRQRRTKTTVLGICCACGAELFALGHSGVVSFCCRCFFFGRDLQTAPFACFLSGVRDGWTARFSRYLAALPPLPWALGHGTVHHNSGCTNWSQISLDILLNERANDGGTAS